MKSVPHTPELGPETINCNLLQNKGSENNKTLSFR